MKKITLLTALSIFALANLSSYVYAEGTTGSVTQTESSETAAAAQKNEQTKQEHAKKLAEGVNKKDSSAKAAKNKTESDANTESTEKHRGLRLPDTQTSAPINEKEKAHDGEPF